MRTGKAFVVLLISLTLLLSFSINRVNAEAADEIRESVYVGSIFNGIQYVPIFSPAEKDTLYLIANTDNAITLKNTLVYFWDTTQEYKAVWSSLNEIVEGEMEIYRGSTLVYQASLEPHTIVRKSDSSLFTEIDFGQEAIQHYQDYQDALNNYQSEYADYLTKEQAYSSELWDRFEHPENYTGALPLIEPSAPNSVSEDMIDLVPSFKVNLPAGSYSMRVIDKNGNVILGSNKKLKVFNELREGVSYVVYTDQEWTQQLVSRDSNEVIYIGDASSLFLQPFLQYEYYADDYLNLTQPQMEFSLADYSMWVDIRPIQTGTLQAFSKGVALGERNLLPFFVEQIPGSQLGYEIKVVGDQTSTNVTFLAYEIDLLHEDVSEVVLKTDGKQVIGSERLIKNLTPANPIKFFIPAFLTLWLGIAIVFLRNRKTRN